MLRRCFFCLLTAFVLLPPLPARAEKNLARPPGTTRYAPMLARLRALLAYDKTEGAGRMALTSLGHSVKGRDLWMVTLHDASPIIIAPDKAAPDNAAEPSAPGTDDTAPAPPQPPAAAVPPRRVFYLCRQHGHEPASTEGALQFITQLVRAAPGSPLAQDLQRTIVYVVPMANPDGAEAFLRHNAHDKDINRDWLRRTQPETQALYRVIMRLRPDLMTDQHELYPDDIRPDFTETVGTGSGASPGMVQTCDTAQNQVQAAMRAAGIPTVSHRIDDHHPARLAHRFGCVVAGVPTLLFETNRLARIHRPVAARAQAHLQFMRAVLGDAAGDETAPAADNAARPAPPLPTAPPAAKDGE